MLADRVRGSWTSMTEATFTKRCTSAAFDVVSSVGGPLIGEFSCLEGVYLPWVKQLSIRLYGNLEPIIIIIIIIIADIRAYGIS